MKDLSECICGSKNVYVIDSRHKLGSIYRRKKCADCGRKFSTYEVDSDTFMCYRKFLSEFSRVKVGIDTIKTFSDEIYKNMTNQK